MAAGPPDLDDLLNQLERSIDTPGATERIQPTRRGEPRPTGNVRQHLTLLNGIVQTFYWMKKQITLQAACDFYKPVPIMTLPSVTGQGEALHLSYSAT